MSTNHIDKGISIQMVDNMMMDKGVNKEVNLEMVKVEGEKYYNIDIRMKL